MGEVQTPNWQRPDETVLRHIKMRSSIEIFFKKICNTIKGKQEVLLIFGEIHLNRCIATQGSELLVSFKIFHPGFPPKFIQTRSLDPSVPLKVVYAYVSYELLELELVF